MEGAGGYEHEGKDARMVRIGWKEARGGMGGGEGQ